MQSKFSWSKLILRLARALEKISTWRIFDTNIFLFSTNFYVKPYKAEAVEQKSFPRGKWTQEIIGLAGTKFRNKILSGKSKHKVYFNRNKRIDFEYPLSMGWKQDLYYFEYPYSIFSTGQSQQITVSVSSFCLWI